MIFLRLLFLQSPKYSNSGKAVHNVAYKGKESDKKYLLTLRI